MIMKALEKGASEQKIADTLDLDVAAIRRRRTMLQGICPEAVDAFQIEKCKPGGIQCVTADEAAAFDRLRRRS